jgi:cyanophycinase
MRSVPQGKLLIIGGSEDKGTHDEQPDISKKNAEFKSFEILGELIPEKKRKVKIEIITTASGVPDLIEKEYRKAFRKVDGPLLGFMHMVNKEEANSEKNIERIKKADSVLFSGGDQFKIASILGGTGVHAVLCDKYMNDPDFSLAGTSAGAMAMAKIMILEGENNEAMLKGEVKTTSGLGFIDHCIIDTHYVKRGRCGRLTQAVLMNPHLLGIGLGEDTALLIHDGTRAICRGSGMVVILDGKDIGHTNIAFAEDNTAICVENMRMHILSDGCGIDLKERKFMPSKQDMQKEVLSKRRAHAK